MRRGLEVSAVLVQRCFLWRGSLSLLARFLAGGRFILREKGRYSCPGGLPSSTTRLKSVKPATQLVYTMGPVAVHDPPGEPEVHLQTMGERHIPGWYIPSIYTRIYPGDTHLGRNNWPTVKRVNRGSREPPGSEHLSTSPTVKRVGREACPPVKRVVREAYTRVCTTLVHPEVHTRVYTPCTP